MYLLFYFFFIYSCAKNEGDKVDIKSDLYGTWFSSCNNYKKTSFNYDLDLQKVNRTLHSYNDNECVYSDNESSVIYYDVSWNEQTVKDSNSNYLNAYKFLTRYQGTDVIWYATEIKSKTYKHGYDNNSNVIFETYSK
jgi:hypothetical protein